MFSDFENHVLGVPQLAPAFGVGTGNVIFDGQNQDEDFGAEQVSGDRRDRYKFRTSPLRNVALQPAFFHNGAFTRLEDAIRYHTNTRAAARTYDPRAAGVASDLQGPVGPFEPMLARLDPLLSTPVALSDAEFRQLADFVRNGLLDARAKPVALQQLIPPTVPSGRSPLTFEIREQRVSGEPCAAGNRRCAP